MLEIFGSYEFIIEASIIIVISFFFNVISQKTNIPSVLMLIGLGLLIKLQLSFMEIHNYNFFPLLQVLGIIGLVMIVLEAALDLKLTREKWPIIWKSFTIALLSLIGLSLVISYVLQYFIEIDFFSALLYAVPLSIMSSAIVIPSTNSLPEEKKEFMVYESTFSDILGIMIFYFLLQSNKAETSTGLAIDISANILLTILISVVASYLLILVIQNIKCKIKLFLLISILFVLYSIGKTFHLSSLLIILIFGLFIENPHLFFRGKMSKYINKEKFKEIFTDFHLITMESSFVVRTFFFVIFGITISISSILDISVIFTSLIILLLIYTSRFLFMLIFLSKDYMPELYIAPRGLISILLFYAIPKEFIVPEFEKGILFFIIIMSCIIMSVSLVFYERQHKKNLKKLKKNQYGDPELHESPNFDQFDKNE